MTSTRAIVIVAAVCIPAVVAFPFLRWLLPYPAAVAVGTALLAAELTAPAIVILLLRRTDRRHR